ncbi:hypothetical protein [Robbsia betulipollinis]|uniref:hypothetical protein n=1 Tax=Robbsia betulipollinis TaxID=2981849 RepID=UPI00226E3983|nr:hypothetical protein [Robbsia betulipollinis]
MGIDLWESEARWSIPNEDGLLATDISCPDEQGANVAIRRPPAPRHALRAARACCMLA